MAHYPLLMIVSDHFSLCYFRGLVLFSLPVILKSNERKMFLNETHRFKGQLLSSLFWGIYSQEVKSHLGTLV